MCRSTISAIIDNARATEEAGAVGLEIEAVSPEVGRAVDQAVEIFSFGIGAANAGCGQLLLGADLIGSFDTFKPKFAKRYGNVGEVATKAFAQYAAEVREGSFPDADHSYKMPAEEANNDAPVESGAMMFMPDPVADLNDAAQAVHADATQRHIAAGCVGTDRTEPRAQRARLARRLAHDPG